MPSRTCVSDVEFAPARRADAQRGLLGFVSFTLDGRLRIDGVALRRTRDGRHSISLPRRRGHVIVRPLAAGGTRALEHQILAHLGLEAAS